MQPVFTHSYNGFVFTVVISGLALHWVLPESSGPKLKALLKK